MRKAALFLIGLVFALSAAACGSSDSETVTVDGGSGDQPAEAPASPTPDDQSGQSGTSSSSEGDEDDHTSTDSSSASSSEDRTDDSEGTDNDDATSDSTANNASGSSSSSDDTAVGTPSPDSAVSNSSDQAGTPVPTPSPTPVVPEGDRRPVTVDDVEIVVRESWPMQVAVMISGSLPTPCHELKWTVEQGATTTEDDWTVAADGSVHNITVWTTDLPSDVVCATVMEPFNEQVELGRFVTGDYTIVVNGESHPVTL